MIESTPSRIDSGNQGIKLQIVGSGPMQQYLQKIISDGGLEDEIVIINNASDLSAILRNTDIYLCTSIFEGVSNAIMEAMAHSLPVVATNAGDNKLLVRDNLNGYILPIKDHIGIGNALSTLMSDYRKRLAFGKKSYELLKQNHEQSVFRDRYLNFITEIQ